MLLIIIKSWAESTHTINRLHFQEFATVVVALLHFSTICPAGGRSPAHVLPNLDLLNHQAAAVCNVISRIRHTDTDTTLGYMQILQAAIKRRHLRPMLSHLRVAVRTEINGSQFTSLYLWL